MSCHGVLSDGTKYESVNFYSQNVTDPPIGHLVDGDKLHFEGDEIEEESDDNIDWWVRSRFENRDFLVTSAKGYSVFILLLKNVLRIICKRAMKNTMFF